MSQRTVAATVAGVFVVTAVVFLVVGDRLGSQRSGETYRGEVGRIEERLAESEKSVMQLSRAIEDRDARFVAELERISAQMKELANARPTPRDEEIAASAASSSAETELSGDEFDLASALDEILAAENDQAAQAQWERIKKAGLLDRAIAELEALADENPDDPENHLDVGKACLQKLFTVSDLEKGKWAMKADGAFNRALELDENHWESRFQKAVALSFWPPVFGKQAEAIENFETLATQQEADEPRPEYEQTYVFLGNLYQQQGNEEKAKATWSRGLERFPESRELAQRTQATSEP